MPAPLPSDNRGRRSRSDSSQLPESPDRRATKRQNATDAQNENTVADPIPPEAPSRRQKKPVAAKPASTKKEKQIKPPSSKGAPAKNEDDGREWSDEDVTKLLCGLFDGDDAVAGSVADGESVMQDRHYKLVRGFFDDMECN